MHFILAQHVLIVNSDLRQHTRPAETCFVNELIDRVKTNVVKAKDGRGIIWTSINKPSLLSTKYWSRPVETKKSISLPIFRATFRYYPTISTNVVINRWNFHATLWHNESRLRTEETEFHSSYESLTSFRSCCIFIIWILYTFLSQMFKNITFDYLFIILTIFLIILIISQYLLLYSLIILSYYIIRYSRNFRYILEILQPTGTHQSPWLEGIKLTN